MAEDRTQVSRPWDSQLRTADQKPKDLPPGTHIAEVFDRRDVGGKLLILGAPGSGKTTTMLDLAAVLIQRANNDPEQPIPVIVSLSSWQDEKQKFTDWLVGELKLKYGVSPKLGKSLLEHKCLLPLLDGLDELSPVRQEPVVQTLNAWLESGQGPTELLVCSRIEEYKLYETNLVLNSAICLEPLTDEQLQSYLNSLGGQYLWEMLCSDEDLLTLLRTPLLLSVAVLANHGIEPVHWQQKETTEARMDYLLDVYVERRLYEILESRYFLKKEKPKPCQTRYWLSWLAKYLKGQFKDKFLIEEMQPSLLKSRHQILLYLVIIGFVFGPLIGLFTSLFFVVVTMLNQGNYERLMIGLLAGLLSAPVLAVWMSLLFLSINKLRGNLGGFKSIETVESLDFSIPNITSKKISKDLLKKPLGGLLLGALLGVGFWLTDGIEIGLLLGLIVGCVGAFYLTLVYLLKADISVHVRPNQGIFFSLKNTILLLLFALPLPFLLKAMLLFWTGPINSVTIDRIITISSGALLSTLIAESSLACICHLALRVALYRTGYIPWNYARFLNYCTERLLLQRVGGRYRFIHKLVQEHFAAMPLK